MSDFAIPPFNVDGLSVLDVGCGNGDHLAGPYYAKASRRVGVDIDADAIEDGMKRYPNVTLGLGIAEYLQFADCSFDAVISRVALPYTDIRVALAEMHRVLKPGGRIFLTMHDWKHQLEFISGAIRQRALKRVLDHAYILPASAAFIAIGICPARPKGTRETFQTEGSLRRELKRTGFTDASFSRSQRHWRVTAATLR